VIEFALGVGIQLLEYHSAYFDFVLSVRIPKTVENMKLLNPEFKIKQVFSCKLKLKRLIPISVGVLY
jgi:hypothetical protein